MIKSYSKIIISFISKNLSGFHKYEGVFFIMLYICNHVLSSTEAKRELIQMKYFHAVHNDLALFLLIGKSVLFTNL